MKYEIRWTSSTSLGASSTGFVGRFATLDEASAALAQEEAGFREAAARQPIADTFFELVRVETDQFGNRDVYPV